MKDEPLPGIIARTWEDVLVASVFGDEEVLVLFRLASSLFLGHANCESRGE